MKKYRSKNPKNHWVCNVDVRFDDAQKRWRWAIYHNDQDDPRNLVMLGYCEDEQAAIAQCEQFAELHVNQIHQNHTGHIHLWFELTYASYLVLPRSLMEAMPGQWQLRFVELMEEFEDTFEYLQTNQNYRVQLQRLVDEVGGEEVYEDLDDPLANYRYPPDLDSYRVKQELSQD